MRKATSSTPANRGIEDYNPFADQGSQGTSQVRGAANPPLYGGIGATQQPATLQPTQETPAPVYSRTPQQNVVTSPPPAATLSPNVSIDFLFCFELSLFINIFISLFFRRVQKRSGEQGGNKKMIYGTIPITVIIVISLVYSLF